MFRKSIKKINPDIKTKSFNKRLDAENTKKLLCGIDVVVDCTDNYETRFLLAQTCFNLNIPMSFGSAVRQEGQTAFFQAGKRKIIINHAMFVFFQKILKILVFQDALKLEY